MSTELQVDEQLKTMMPWNGMKIERTSKNGLKLADKQLSCRHECI